VRRPKTRRAAAPAALLCAALAACAATSNPAPGEVRPLAPAPTPASSSAALAAGAPAAASAAQQDEVAEPAREPEAAAQTPGAEPAQAPPSLVIGSVGGEAIEAQALLERLWMRDSRSVLDQFEFLVFSRIALFESDRIGVRVSPEQVDLVVQRTLAAVTERLKRTAPGLSLDQFVARVLELDRTSYDRKVRTDAVLQLLTERCVRAWFLETPRRDLDLIEFADDAALAAGQAALAAGTAFEEVARLHGLPEDAEAGGLHMTLARNEESDLARAAFATPIGAVGGPIARDGHHLLVRPVREHEPVEGPWGEIAERVEQSLALDPLDAQPMTKEYEQWRTAMTRRYPLDLSPFIELVRTASP
jgi:hypothetical protein